MSGARHNGHLTVRPQVRNCSPQSTKRGNKQEFRLSPTAKFGNLSSKNASLFHANLQKPCTFFRKKILKVLSNKDEIFIQQALVMIILKAKG